MTAINPPAVPPPALDLPPTPPLLPPGTVPVPAGEVFAIAQEYVAAGRLDAADRMLGHVLTARPDQPDALHLKGLIAYRRGRRPEAVALIERAIRMGGQRPVHYRNLSELCRLETRLDDALAAARRAIALDPADALGLFNLAMVHYDRLEIGPCIAAARAALDLKPRLPQAHMKLAQVLLLKGDLTEGWAEYEWRYQIPGAAPLMPSTDRPQWNGAPLVEPRLLLIADQGYGDVIQFARYIPWVMERCQEVVIACSKEIAPILDSMYPGLKMFHRWEECPPIACYCPLSGLPRLHGTTLANVPTGIPYLTPNPARVRLWRERLDRLVPQGLRRIGIAWAGRPTHNNDINRSTALDRFVPIADVPGIALISLQKGPAVSQIANFPGRAPFVNLDSQIESFEDTAAIIDGLDLLVTVDTAIGHLAGAMGRPAWIMLPYAPDWRWLLGRSDTPWYPTLRLFRPPGPRRWDAIVPEVARALDRFVAAPR